MLQQRQHKTGSASNQRSERRKAIFAWDLWVSYSASEWLSVNALARQTDSIFGFLANHLGIDAVTRGICEDLQRFIKATLFSFVQVIP